MLWGLWIADLIFTGGLAALITVYVLAGARDASR